MKFIDSHCHLSFPDLAADIQGVLARMEHAGVVAAVNICVTLPEFGKVVALAHQHAHVYATAGVHPDTVDIEEPSIDELVAMADDPKVVAIGETGLDYFRLVEPLDWQRDRFRVHIRAARECGKPLVIHTRAASADTLRLMKEEKADEAGGVMHCFTESWDVAQAAMDLGFYISMSGIVTFKSARDLQQVARQIPLDRLLIETDSPYLAPVPHRGRPNEPSYVPLVAAFIAELRGVPVDTIARHTSENASRLFRLAQ